MDPTLNQSPAPMTQDPAIAQLQQRAGINQQVPNITTINGKLTDIANELNSLGSFFKSGGFSMNQQSKMTVGANLQRIQAAVQGLIKDGHFQ